MDATVPDSSSVIAALQSLSTARRWSIAAGGIAVLVAVAVFVRMKSHEDRVAALNGQSFTASQAESAKQQLQDAGLREFLYADGQFLIPVAERERYEAVLNQQRKDSGTWIDRWHESDSVLGQFADGRQQQARRDDARARLISELLAQLPDVAHAEIVWDEETQAGWRRPPRGRATVYLEPQPDHEISIDTIEAVRVAVAGSKAHLTPADVVVMDLEKMVTYAGPEAAQRSTEQEGTSRQTSALRTRIEAALSDIEGVRVSVAMLNRELSPGNPEQAWAARPAVQFEELSNAELISVANVGLEITPVLNRQENETTPTFSVTGDPLESGEPNDGSRTDAASVVVHVPAGYLQTQLANRIPETDRLAARDSAQLTSQVEADIQAMIERRITHLLASSRLAASVIVETEPVPIDVAAEPVAATRNSGIVAAITGSDARTWSMWAVVFGFGASLCWWLRDVIEWHGSRTGAATATNPAVIVEPDDSNAPITGIDLHGAESIEGLLQSDADAVRRYYAAVPSQVWALALRGETERVVSRLLAVLDSDSAAELRKAVRSHRPVRLREIEDAQQQILSGWSAALQRAA